MKDRMNNLTYTYTPTFFFRGEVGVTMLGKIEDV